MFLKAISDGFKSLFQLPDYIQRNTWTIEHDGYIFKKVTTYFNEIKPASEEWFVNNVKVTYINSQQVYCSFVFVYLPYDGRNSISNHQGLNEELSKVVILGSRHLPVGQVWVDRTNQKQEG